ncbi:bifunctional adenosylcobinamide kinase/adenosylcobinamide-phosphate guanylyltransferase [Candidatus Aerophobetes bacterium]|nr:bifunctional adenosylcobinamide kinase/adenosylcobinamide-phosphate guanylyltransferase [Candidatus Aerophobetes bacterium]
MPELILITGGARSGKSRFAVELASSLSHYVTFIATAVSLDKEMQKRISTHKRARPSHWQTIEEQKNVASVLSSINSPERVVIIDCLTLLTSNLLLDGEKESDILNQIREIADKGRKCNQVTIVVSNEVGWGVVPATKLGRDFRDIAGAANQIVASKANRVYLLISGIACKLKEEKI